MSITDGPLGNYADENRSRWGITPTLTVLNDAGNAYGYCNVADRGDGGNPWDVDIPDPLESSYVQPNYVINCDDLEGFQDLDP